MGLRVLLLAVLPHPFHQAGAQDIWWSCALSFPLPPHLFSLAYSWGASEARRSLPEATSVCPAAGTTGQYPRGSSPSPTSSLGDLRDICLPTERRAFSPPSPTPNPSLKTAAANVCIYLLCWVEGDDCEEAAAGPWVGPCAGDICLALSASHPVGRGGPFVTRIGELFSRATA